MVQTRLDIPTRFTWGTGASRTITPAAAGIDPADGWDFSKRPPPKLMNYIHNLQGEWAEREVIRMLANPRTNTNGVAANCRTISRNVNNGLWILTTTTVATHTSYDGVNFSAAGNMAAAANYSGAINTDTDGIIVGTNSGVEYSADASAWGAAGAGSTSAIANVGTSDFFLRAAGSTLERWLTGIAGGVTAPSVTSWGATTITTLAGDTGENNWVILDANGDCHLSTDGGDNWVQAAISPVDVIAGFSPYNKSVDYCDGTIVAGGAAAGGGCIAYSHDDGATWTAANFAPASPVGGAFLCVRALGNGYWMACGSIGLGINTVVDYWYSTDDGETWYICAPIWDGSNCSNMTHVWCAGDIIAGCGDSNSLLLTDSLNLFG